jgi:HTH-type transcriptional regulator/antitoxin HigA
MVEIKNEIQYEKLCERIEELLKVVDDDTPLTDKKMVELEIISLLVAEYEEKHHPIEPPTLIEMVRERMSEMKLSQKDLAELLGVSPPRISEYLNGKSEPTLKVARLMYRKLDIDPEIVLG